MIVKLTALLTFGQVERITKDQTEKTDGNSFMDMLVNSKGKHLYVALYKQDPNGWLEEAHYPKYKRVEMRRDRTAWKPFQRHRGGFLIANTEIIKFPFVTGKAAMVTHVAICLENGKAVAAGKLDIPAVLMLSDNPVFMHYDLKISL